MATISTTDGSGFAATVRVICLGCGHESDTIGEHKRHLSTADHPDEGEACK